MYDAKSRACVALFLSHTFCSFLRTQRDARIEPFSTSVFLREETPKPRRKRERCMVTFRLIFLLSLHCHVQCYSHVKIVLAHCLKCSPCLELSRAFHASVALQTRCDMVA